MLEQLQKNKELQKAIAQYVYPKLCMLMIFMSITFALIVTFFGGAFSFAGGYFNPSSTLVVQEQPSVMIEGYINATADILPFITPDLEYLIHKIDSMDRMIRNCSSCEWREVCIHANDIIFYSPLTEEESGTYPSVGLVPDSVEMRKQNSVSIGFIDIYITFPNIPESFSDAYISMRFVDQDHHGDVIEEDGNVLTLHETYELYDTGDIKIAHLKYTHHSDDNFMYELGLDNKIFYGSEESVTFRMRFTSKVEWVTGNGRVTVGDTKEAVRMIKICGNVEG